jgi:cell division protein FtsB
MNAGAAGAAGAAVERSRTRITPRAAILALVVFVLLLYLVVPLKTFMAQRARLSHLEGQEQVLEQQNAALRRQVTRLHNPAYLERVARECLGMVKSGEIAFVVAPQGGTPAPPADC